MSVSVLGVHILLPHTVIRLSLSESEWCTVFCDYYTVLNTHVMSGRLTLTPLQVQMNREGGNDFPFIFLLNNSFTSHNKVISDMMSVLNLNIGGNEQFTSDITLLVT